MLSALLFALALQTAGSEKPACVATYEAEEKALLPALDRGDSKAANPALDRLEAACRDNPRVMALFATWRAQLLIGEGKAAEAIAVLDRPGVDQGPSRHDAQWLLLSAYEATADAANFRRVRDRMLADNDDAMSGGRPALGMAKRERFETPAAVVDVYEGRLIQGPFVRRYIFVAAPKDGGMFVTLALTAHTTSLALEGEGTEAYFIDLYPCSGHSTLDVISGKKDQWPDYDRVKAKAKEVFSSAAAFARGKEDGAGRRCGFTRYMLPGIG